LKEINGATAALGSRPASGIQAVARKEKSVRKSHWIKLKEAKN
jgi:hypothetical protein